MCMADSNQSVPGPVSGHPHAQSAGAVVVSRAPGIGAFLPPSQAMVQVGRDEMMQQVLGTLRGRYKWVVLLGLIMAGAFGYGGWKLFRPTYRSSSLLRIAYTLPAVLRET